MTFIDLPAVPGRNREVNRCQQTLHSSIVWKVVQFTPVPYYVCTGMTRTNQDET